MRELSGRRILITGGGSGIGRAAAHAFAGEGSRLLLVDLSSVGLESVVRELTSQGADCHSFVVDVSSSAEVRTLAIEVEKEHGGVDVLVNAAGVVIAADIVDTRLDDWAWVLGANLMGPIHTMHFFLPGMIERREGHVVNVASFGGLLSFGMLGAYCASKFGLVGLSEALQHEVAKHGIGVTVFCPGLTRTSLVDNARFRGYSEKKITRSMGWLMSGPGAISAERTGELIVEAVRCNRALVVTTPIARFAVGAKRLSPSLVRLALLQGRKLDIRLFR